MTELDPGAAAGDERGAIGKVVNRANVAAEDDSCVIEQAAAVGSGHGFQFVEQASVQLGVGGIPLLRGFHALAGVVVAHVVGGHLDADAVEQAGNGPSISVAGTYCCARDPFEIGKDNLG